MALDNFINTAVATGYIADDVEQTAVTDAVTVQLVDGLSMEKTADRQSWANGYLLYTIVITNNSGETYNNVTITDQLGLSEDDLALITYVTGTARLNGVAVPASYDVATNILSITPDPQLNIADGATATITFQVQKSTP